MAASHLHHRLDPVQLWGMSNYTPKPDRYDAVADSWFRPCGRSGLKLPAISLGMWHNFGDAGTDAARHNDEASMHDSAQRMCFTALDHGITHFDLANAYGPPAGSAEQRVGRILKNDLASHRDELIISTKAGHRMWPGPYGQWASRKHLLASLDHSLQRLGLDYVDIYYSHRPDPAVEDGGTPIEETMAALDYLVKSGKVLYTGISSYSAARTVDALLACESQSLTRPTIHQPSYNMLSRWIEKDLLPQTHAHGLGVIVFCPLAQGQLTSKYLAGIPEDSRAAAPNGFLKKEQITSDMLSRVSKLNDLAQDRGQTLAQMALAWVLRAPRKASDGRVASALIGASRPEQIVENVKALDNAVFSEDELRKIDEILA